MKKTLLVLLITGFWSSTQAQNNVPLKPIYTTFNPEKVLQAKFKTQQVSEKAVALQPSSSKTTHSHKISNPPPLPQLGSSASINGVRNATTTATTANQACDLIVMTHREDYSKEGNCGTGAYEAAYSTNNGATWDTNVVLFCNDPTRYPNGALFNPAGNINPGNVIDAMSGPWTNSSNSTISWVENVFGSIGINNSNAHNSYWINGSPGVKAENTGNLGYMSSSDDSTVHVMGQGFNENPAQTANTAWLGAVLTTGKFNAVADSFKWSQTVFRPHLVPNIKGFRTSVLPFDSDVNPLIVPGTAWSQDGRTGYAVIFGSLDSVGYNYEAPQPIVYKTTNSGKTWAMMPPFNFGTLPTLTTYLYPSVDSGVKTPLFLAFVIANTITGYAEGAQNDYDLTVDINGNLHIFSTVISSAFSRPDSAYAITWFNNQHGYIYDVATSGASWTARYIDSMNNFPTHVVTAAMSSDWDNTSASSVAMGNRLQASRTTNGDHVFCTWEDDFLQVQPDSIVNPDVKGQGYDVTTTAVTPVYQFTNTGINYFLCASDIVLTAGNGPTNYTIPCTIVYPQEFPSDGSTPINYYYLGVVQYNDNEFVTTGSHSMATPGFSVSPNYPNPFSNITNFTVNLSRESEVSVDVFNLLGEKVFTISPSEMSSGTHLIAINGSGWNAGVYFYKVTADSQSITRKMVIQ